MVDKKPRKKRDWGDAYYSALAKGYDHGYAAHVADQAMKRQEKKKKPKNLTTTTE